MRVQVHEPATCTSADILFEPPPVTKSFGVHRTKEPASEAIV
jgi:hypothetical protein